MKSKKILIIAFLIVSMVINSASTVLATTVDAVNEVVEAEKTEKAEKVEKLEESKTKQKTEVKETPKVEATTADEKVTNAEQENTKKAEKVNENAETKEVSKDAETKEVSKDAETKEVSKDAETKKVSKNAETEEVGKNVATEDLSDNNIENKSTEIQNKSKSNKDLQDEIVWESGKISQKYVSEDGSTYEVKVSYGKNARISNKSTLKILEFTENSNEYNDAKRVAVADIVERNDDANTNTMKMVALDISIIDENGNEIEPEAPVSVEIKIKSLPGVENLNEVADSLEIQHHKETKDGIVVEHFDCSDGLLYDNYIDKKFNVNSFSTFVIKWGGLNNDTYNATVHYVYKDGNEYKELGNPNPEFATDNNSGYKFLIYDFEGYKYSTTKMGSATGTTIKPLLGKYNNNEIYLDNNNNWQYLNNGSNIYVIYEKSEEPSTGGNLPTNIPVPDEAWPTTPKVEKSSKSNGDGTREISLDVVSKTNDIYPSELADVIVIFDVSGSMNENFSGRDTRLASAKAAVKSLANTLLNTDQYRGKIRMSLISFSTTATEKQDFTTSYSTFTSQVDSLTASGGTNWEQALKLANNKDVDPNRETFVIFVTDGNPTFRESRMNQNDNSLDMYTGSTYQYYRDNNVFGEGDDDTKGYNYNAALNVAQSIVNHNKHFYTIGISNDVTSLNNLCSQSGANASDGKTHSYMATNSTQLNAAFAEIGSSISATVGYTATVIDGVTGLTNLIAKTPIVGVDENSFTYYKNGTPMNIEEEGISPAIYNPSTGAVEWNLGDNYQLEDGVKYTVKFTVWPSQQSIDYVTDLNNGLITYEQLKVDHPEDAEQIDEHVAADGVTKYYTLKTNTNLNVEYQKSVKVGDTVTTEGTPVNEDVDYNVGPLDLDTMTLKVEKTFKDSLTDGEDQAEEVELFVERRVVNGDGTYGDWEKIPVPYKKPDGTSAITDNNHGIILSQGNNWKAEFYISPGFETEHNGEKIIYNQGYEYRLTEPGVDYHYELNSEITRPMLKNMNKIYEGDNGDGILTAENIVKGGINIRKILLDQDGNEIIDDDTEFVFRGYILNKDNQPYTWKNGDDIDASGAYHKWDAQGNRIVYKGHFSSTENIEFTLKAGESLRFINVPKDSTYEFYEVTDNLTNGYNHISTVAYNKTVDPNNIKDENGNFIYIDYSEQPTVTNNVASGTVYGNVEHNVDITNKLTAVDVTFEGTKSVTGRAMTSADIFEFEVSDGTNTWTVKNDENGKINYPTIRLTDEGVYTYTVKEKSTSKDGITVDSRNYQVTVTVTKDAQGKLVANLSDNATKLDFENKYNASDSITFKGTKSLEGRKLKKDEFSFEIKDEKGNTWEAKNDENGNIVYPVISYTQADAGEHTYTIKETTTNGNGITVDNKTYTVKVNVTDNGNGTLKIEFSGDNHEALNFENKYEATGSIVFKGTKTLNGRKLNNGEFTFEIKEGNTVIGTAKNDENGNISYPTIKYDLDDVGEHIYTVKEITTNGNGITVDTKEYTVKVNVSDNGDGKLNVTSNDKYNELNFVNTYEAKDQITFKGMKTIDGRTLTENDKFTFTVIEKVSKDGTVTDKVIGTATNDSTGKISYPTIEYTQEDEGLHTYVIKETSTSGSGITVDSKEYTVTVNVTDNKDGTLKIEYSNDAMKLDFKNIYDASESITFRGTKTLNGRILKEGEFKFEVKEGSTVIGEATNDANGNISYPTINYDLDDVGEHIYTVKEITTNGNGIEVDKITYTITVNVSDNGDGTLKVEPSENYNKLNFINNYTATGKVTFVGTKTLNGRALKEGEFKFEVKEGNTVIGEATNDANGNISYPTINYDLDDVGEHTYTVKEMTTNGNGITVDQTTYTVTVNVSDNGNGTLKVEPSENYNKLNFVNTYTAEGELVLEGEKTLTGRNMTKDDKFTFEVIENQDGKNVTVATGTNNGTETITFEKIKYTLDDVGEHTYTVKETSTNGDGITVDQTTYTVTANVSDNGDGTLKVEASNNSKTLNFVNKYNAIGGITFTGTKTIDGRELTENDVFTFEVKDEKGTTWVAKNDSDGKINYPVISYTLEDVGEHTYTVKETSTNGNGITVDTTEYKVIVNVSDNGKGALNIEITGDNNTKLDFVNIYTATGNITFKGNKKIDTRELTENDVFTFEIKEGDKVIATVSNDATGNISYPTINYELKDVGEHIYTIYETSKEGKGITPDTKTYTVKVDVSDNGKGKLNTDITGDNYQELNFVNKYEAEGEITFEGEKLINGRQMTINDNYTFMVKEDDNTVATGTNNGTETITFEKIKYTLDDVGTHTYIVSESDDEAEKLAENGITLDSNTYTVTVKVSDNKDGTLKVESSDNSTKLNFVNTYKANGNAEFVVTKALDGEELKADQFKFELKDSEGNTLKTATNDAEGNIKFEAIEYTEQNVGNTYSYTIKEIDDGADGYVYDEMIVEITVNVADNGDGTLKIDTNYSEDTEFNNKYETVEVSVQKIWDDNNNQDGVRPESIEVTLAGNGNNIETVELSEANNWTYTWKELVKHSNKTDIKYTVEEAELDGYVATVETDVDATSGNVTATITNTHEIEKVDVKAIKIWDDANNYDNYRPDSINVQLYANGNAYGDEITLNDSNNWSYTWEGLDKNESGEEIEYTVEETVVPDKYEVEYSVDEDGTLVITNKQIPGEGGYEEPPAEPIEPPAKPAEPVVIYEGDNPGTGTTIFDSFGLYFALILAAITLVFVETRKFYKNKA